VALFNRGDHFLVAPLPFEAQVAPAFGVCVADLDGDGYEDVFLSQNCFAVPLTEYQWQAALNFTYVPMYGKFAGFSDFIFHYDAYVVGGVGALSTRPIPTIDPDNRSFSFEPKLVGISVEKTAFTHELIEAGKAFSLNLLPQEERAAVRKFVKPVEVDAGGTTLNGFAFHDGRTGAPILDIAAAWVDCEVRQSIDCGCHTFFIGEVVDAGFQADEETPVLRMEDTRMSYGG